MGELRDEISNDGLQILSTQVVDSARSLCITNEILSSSNIGLADRLLVVPMEKVKGFLTLTYQERVPQNEYLPWNGIKRGGAL